MKRSKREGQPCETQDQGHKRPDPGCSVSCVKALCELPSDYVTPCLNRLLFKNIWNLTSSRQPSLIDSDLSLGSLSCTTLYSLMPFPMMLSPLGKGWRSLPPWHEFHSTFIICSQRYLTLSLLSASESGGHLVCMVVLNCFASKTILRQGLLSSYNLI